MQAILFVHTIYGMYNFMHIYICMEIVHLEPIVSHSKNKTNNEHFPTGYDVSNMESLIVGQIKHAMKF